MDDLVAIDGDIANVAVTEEIISDGAGSFINSALEECAGQLISSFQSPNYAFLATQTGQFGFFPGLISDSTPPGRIKVGQIVIDSDTSYFTSPLVRFVRYLALRNFYQIVSGRKIDDRYQSKLKQIQKDLDNKYWPQLRGSGLPVVYTPIPCPGAVYELNTGTWDTSNVSEMSGGSASAATWDVAITWQSNSTAESAPSGTVTIGVDANNLLDIDISSLIPPANPIIVSWKIYAGVTGQTLFYQATVPIATKTYTFTDIPVTSGTPVGRGQSKDTNLTFINTFFRA